MSTAEIVQKFAPAAAEDEPNLKRLAAHYTVEAYVLHMEAFVGRSGEEWPPAGSTQRQLRRMEMCAALNTWTAATALNALLWPDDYDAAELIQNAHDGDGEESSDVLDEWMDRHGIDRQAVIDAVEASRKAN